MKHWQETTSIFLELARLGAEGQTAALATLVWVEGSSYRRPGAKLLIHGDGGLTGNVSGGCLEADLRERGQRVMQTGVPESVHYETGEDDDVLWGLGLGCNGKVDLFVQPCVPGLWKAHVANVLKRLEGDGPFALRTVIEGPDVGTCEVLSDSVSPQTTIGEDGDRVVFVEWLEPPCDLMVIGAGDDAVPLVAMAEQVGFRVTVVDHRRAYLAEERFPGARQLVCRRPEDGLGDLPANDRTFVVIMNHAIQLDREWAKAYAGTDVPYIGLLGPKSRRDEILKEISPEARSRCYGPVGLDVGAEGEAQIALSIIAEVLAVAGAHNGGHLRERGASIHGPRK